MNSIFCFFFFLFGRNNQFGNKILWNPITNPNDEPELRVQVSIDAGKSWLREQTQNPAGFIIKYKVCEKVDTCSPFDGNSCYDCHEGLNVITIEGTLYILLLLLFRNKNL